MRTDVKALIDNLLSGLRDAEMRDAADAMGISLATAYRYRKSPLDMSLKVFLGLVGHLNVHIDMSVTLHQEELVDVEILRLKLEKAIADIGGYRIVTTPHFSVNCELPEITRMKFRDRYNKQYWNQMDEFVHLRKKRQDLYFSGKYTSKEIINGDAYIDFFKEKSF